MIVTGFGRNEQGGNALHVLSQVPLPAERLSRPLLS